MKDENRTKSDLIREAISLRKGMKRLETEVSRRKKTEAELRETSGKFKAMADLTSDWEFWIDTSGRFLYVSPSCEGITGYKPDSFLRNPKFFLKIVHPDDRNRVEDHMALAKKRRDDASIDFRIKTKGGDIRWIGHRCRPILADGGKRAGIRGSNRDITAEKSARLELERLNEQFQRLFQGSGTGICIVDENGRYLLMNDKVAAGLGISPCEAVGKSMFEFLDRATAEKYIERNRQLIQTGGRREYEDTFDLPTGKRSYLIVDQCLSDVNGRNYAVQSSAIEITERKQAEDDLRESEARFRNLFENSSVGISQTLPDGSLVCANNVFAEIFGYSNPKQMISEVTDVAKQVYANSADREEVLRSVRDKGYGKPREIIAVRRDGSRIDVLAGIGEIRDAEGMLLSYQASVVDISERKNAEQRLKRRQDELQAVYDHATTMMAVLDENRNVIFANRKFAETVGKPAERLVSETACGVLGCVSALDDPRGCGYGPLCAACGLHLAIEDTIKTGRSHRDVEHATAVDRGGGRQEVVWLAATASIPTGDRPMILLELQDVTRQRQMEKALRKSEESYRAVVEDQTEIISRFRTDGTILFVNDVYCRFFGKTIEEIIGSKWQPLAVLEDVSHIEGLLHKLSPLHPTVFVENRVHTGDGEVRWMQFVNRGFFNEKGDLDEIQSVGRDITERKNAEEKAAIYRKELQHLTRRLVHVQEKERLGISRELHDEIGQALTAVKINLNEMEKDIPPECKPMIRMRLSESDSLVDQMLEQIHEMSLDLHPTMLEDLGLVPTLRWYGRRFAKRVGVDVAIDTGDMPESMDSDLEINLYRIFQEALTNIAKHAHAKKVVIRLVLADSTVQLSITDDGAGFNPKKPSGEWSGSSGIGLVGMQERVASMQGRLTLESESGRGTRLLISVPWKVRTRA